MREDIKNIIEQIYRGEVPNGYKKSKSGIIPNDWSSKQFSDIAELRTEKFDPTKSKENYNCIELENINQNIGTINGYTDTQFQLSMKNKFYTGDVLYGKLRPYLRKYYYANFEGVSSSEIWVFQNKNMINNQYLFYIVQTDAFNDICVYSGCGSRMPRADWQYVRQCFFSIPSENEQEKIAEILSTQDKIIELKQNLIEQKKLQKQYLVQNIFNKKNKNKIKIEDIFEEISEKNHKNETVLTIIQGTGTVPRENSGREILYEKDNLSNYKFVKKGDFIIHLRSFEGGLEIANQNGIVSPAYIILRAKKEISHKYFYTLFHTNQFINQTMAPSVEGVRDGRSVKYDTLKKQFIFLPTLEEQKYISQILTTADKEIELLQQELEQEKLKKKSLSQLLLTGIVRVNCNN